MAITTVELACVASSSVSYSLLQQSSIGQSKRTHIKLPTLQNAFKGASKASLHALGGVGRGGAAAEGSPGGCCGGSGNGSGGCGSHSKRSSDLANVGKEFEAMAASTLQEFEKDYNSAEMQGTITRDIMQEVMNTCAEELTTSEGEKFLNIEEVLDEARSLSKGDFVFEVGMDEVIL